MPELFAYTDGACSGNPGPGGWGVVLEAWQDGRLVKAREIGGAEARTTNNRMELMAAIGALEALTRPGRITIVTDSNYLRHGITEWIHRWKRNGWKTSDKKPVKNEDLWRRLDAAAARHEVRWKWIKGHSGHDQNERADRLARDAIKALKQAAAEA